MRAQQKGFTLVELMIVVAIIAILASVAYPAYIRHVVKARRVAAASCMMEMAQFAERYYTTNMKYSGLALPNAACMQEVGDHYTIASVAGDLTDTTFTLTATPKGGQAAKDTSCGTLQIDQKGMKSVTGSDSSQPGRCF